MENVNVQEREQRARSLFLAGYNCCQSVVLAYADYFGLEEPLAARLSASLGGGMGRLREVCGAVSGMALLAGLMAPADDPTDRAARTANYALVQHLAEGFRQENGAIVCRELLGLGQTREEPAPSERTPEYYRKRPCVEYVATAARLVGAYLNEKK